MIDVEPIVFDEVKSALLVAYPGIIVLGEPPEQFAKFPTVVIEEIDNRTLQKTQDGSASEHHATVTYEINVYTNDQAGRKRKARSLMNVCDNKMQSMMFTRTLETQLPTVDRTIFRLYCRYRAVVGEPDEDSSGNKTFHVYRG